MKDLYTEFTEETKKDIFTPNDYGGYYYSDEYVEWLEQKLAKLCTIPRVIKSVCIAPKGECDRKPEDVCKECEGCKYLEQTVL